nr:hypothetical protein [Neisseria meningitidis]
MHVWKHSDFNVPKKLSIAALSKQFPLVWKHSDFNVPKKLSIAALSKQFPLRDIL